MSTVQFESSVSNEMFEQLSNSSGSRLNIQTLCVQILLNFNKTLTNSLATLWIPGTTQRFSAENWASNYHGEKIDVESFF